MKIVIMRHGDATFSDADRILSEKGNREAASMAVQLGNLLRIDRCLCSPKTRALQTASILKSRAFDCDIEIERMLTPSGDPDQIISYIDSIAQPDRNLLIVSHLPLVEILSYELNKRMSSPPMFDTACALIIDYNGEFGKYDTFVSPEHGIMAL